MNCNNLYHIESEQVLTCLNMFRHVENHMNRNNLYHVESEQV